MTQTVLPNRSRAAPEPMSRQEFQSRVRASRRVLLPIGILVLILVFAGPFWLFGIIIPPFQAALRACLGISRDTADLVCFGLMRLSPFVLLLPVLYINRHYGLFCPRCVPRTHFFVNHVSKYGTCPKCKCQIIDPA